MASNLEIENIIDITKRPRRNRKSHAIRSIVQETRLHPSALSAPLFVVEGKDQIQPIKSMPGISRFSIDHLVKEVRELYKLGIRSIDLFPLIPANKKDQWASESIKKDNLIYNAIRAVKDSVPEMCVMVDIALDPYTDHGHDGIADESGTIINDETVYILGKMSVLAAEAGVDIVAPSDMMDGRIAFIRKILDQAGFSDVNILSYAAKYASSFYGPFRDALESNLKFGDKKTYQMNPANVREALLEIALDESEGADILLIKPALAYLDVIAKAKMATNLPIGAYHVSGEYSMAMAAGQLGWLDADKVLYESLLSIKRAGADFILTYAAKKVAKMLRDSEE